MGIGMGCYVLQLSYCTLGRPRDTSLLFCIGNRIGIILQNKSDYVINRSQYKLIAEKTVFPDCGH